MGTAFPSGGPPSGGGPGYGGAYDRNGCWYPTNDAPPAPYPPAPNGAGPMGPQQQGGYNMPVPPLYAAHPKF